MIQALSVMLVETAEGGGMVPLLIGLGVNLVVAIITFTVVFTTLRTHVVSLTTGQATMAVSVSKLADAVNSLSMGRAVADIQAVELLRRLALMEADAAMRDESIAVLRTKLHMVSAKLMQLDPAWVGYQGRDSG